MNNLRHMMNPLDFSVEELEKLFDLANDIENNMDAYAHKLGDAYAVCRKGIQVGIDWGGNDGDDLDDAVKGSSSSGGCDTQTGVGLWGACGVALALLFVRRNKPMYRGRAADYF